MKLFTFLDYLQKTLIGKTLRVPSGAAVEIETAKGIKSIDASGISEWCTIRDIDEITETDEFLLQVRATARHKESNLRTKILFTVSPETEFEILFVKS